MKEVWICDPNYHKIRRSFALIFSKNYQCFESYIKHEEECFIRYPNTSKLVKKNSAAPRFFNPLLSVWISDETLFLVFDILLKLNAFALVGRRVAFFNWEFSMRELELVHVMKILRESFVEMTAFGIFVIFLISSINRFLDAIFIHQARPFM